MSFFIFRGALAEAGYNFADFVAKELEISYLGRLGWNEATPLALFHWEFQPIHILSTVECRCRVQADYVETWWGRKLEMIKAGQDPDSEPALEHCPPVCFNCHMDDSPFLFSF
jgi:hypothetical protein